MRARYDSAGNLLELKIERAGTCATGASGSKCAQWFTYDWDEVGQLVRARRWDFTSELPVLAEGEVPEGDPEWDLRYAYSGGMRVVKSAMAAGVERHTLEIFGTLRIEDDEFRTTTGDYKRHRGNTHAYLAGGAAHVLYDGGTLPAPAATKATRLFLVVGDHLGSASVTIDHTSGETVERATFQSHGAIESDYRPARWGSAREPYKFTGKEEDIEVGLTYFGARYYQPHLGRFVSADPLAIHAMGADLNPYAYVRGRVMSHVDPLGLADTVDPGKGAEVITDEVEVRGTPRNAQVDVPAATATAYPLASGFGADPAGLLSAATLENNLADAFGGQSKRSFEPRKSTTRDHVKAAVNNALITASVWPFDGLFDDAKEPVYDSSAYRWADTLTSAVVLFAAPAALEGTAARAAEGMGGMGGGGGSRVALSLGESLPAFEARTGAKGWTWWDGAGSFESNFGRATRRADSIHFNLTGLSLEEVATTANWSRTGGALTNAEFRSVISNPALLGKTTFYLNGSTVPTNQVVQQYGQILFGPF